MKTDGEISYDVIGGLERDPQITNSDAIGLAVKDGAVTLTGNVPTYADKLHAPATSRDDSEIATAIAHALENNVQVPRAMYTPGYRTAGSLVGGSLFPRRALASSLRALRSDFPGAGSHHWPFGRSQYFPNGRR